MAGHKTWAVAEEVVQTDLQGYLADQIVAQFTNTTNRDLQWPSPPSGAMCVIVGNGQLQQRLGGAWYANPGGVLATIGRATDAGPQGAEAAVSGLSVTVTVPTGRYVCAEFCFSRVNGSVANMAAFVRIKDNGTTIREHQVNCNASNAGNGGSPSRLYVPSSGSHTYTVTLEGIGGNATIVAGTEADMRLTVYDRGAT